MPQNNTSSNASSGSMKGPGGRAATQGKIRIEKGSGATLKRMLAYLGKGQLARFILSLAMMGVTALVSVKGSMFLKTLIDDYIEPLLLTTSPEYSGLLAAIAKMGAIYLAGIIATLTYQLLMVKVANGVLLTVRSEMFDHMQTLPIRYFDSRQYGDIMSCYTNDIDTMRQLMSESIPHVFSSMITIVSLLIAMIKLSPALTLVEFACVFIMYIVTITIGGKSASFFGLRQKALGGMNAHIEEMLSGQKVVKVFCHEDEASADFNRKNEELCETTTKANTYANILMPIMGNLGNIQYVILAVFGGYFAINGVGGLTLGGIASFLTIAKNFSMPVSQISQQINSVVMALAGAKRVFALIDEAPETDDGSVKLVYAEERNGVLCESEKRTGLWAWKDGETLSELKGDIRLNDVEFGYVEGKTVLHDIDIYAYPGQKIAFVGSTGAGKTTITNLINRFYDIQDGEILYDGIDIKRINKNDLRRSLGMVLQDVNLFSGTIRDNIRYGRPDASDEDVIKAAKLANADRFIRKLPDGYDTFIDAGNSQLSQGQCQLLSIARCAVMDPPVMILDEATSSVDTRTEALIQKGMDSLMKGRTTFVIAHRLSTVQNSDAIMVLENGRIIERGNHDDLIAQQGRYYQLYTGGKPVQA